MSVTVATTSSPVQRAASHLSAAAEDWVIELESGLRMALPSSMRSFSTRVMLEQQRCFEPEIGLLRHVLEPGMNALDIGADHGVYALEIARLNPAGHVWAFEPTREPRRRLQRSLKLNGLQSRVTLVPAGLADRTCDVQFAIHENSELNARGGRASRRERVRLQALDDYLARAGVAAPIGFVKLSAEGCELSVLAGARRFFEQQSPVVLFVFRRGASCNTALADALVQLGFGIFQWSAELSLLLPFDHHARPCSVALKLVAVRPAQQLQLQLRGVLATSAALAAAPLPPVTPQALRDWCAQPAMMGEALPGADALFDELCRECGAEYATALAMVAAAHGQPGLQPAERVLLVQTVRAKASEMAGLATPGATVWQGLLVHTLLALGLRSAALGMAQQALKQWPDDVPQWPVATPQRADLRRSRSTQLGSWLRQVLREFVARCDSFPGASETSQPGLWAQLMQHPDHGDEVERRCVVAHALCDRVVAVQGLVHLPPAADSPNAALWRGLLQAIAALQPRPAPTAAERCAALRQRVDTLAARPRLRWTLVMSAVCDGLQYVSPAARAELAQLVGHDYVSCTTAASWAALDVVFVTAHGSDTTAQLSQLRARAPQALIAMWLWDNHLAPLHNRAGVEGADFYFHSHDYEGAYLCNLFSVRGGHVPACTAQWSQALAAQLFADQQGAAREGRMLLNYVDYAWSWRSEVIARVAAHVPEATVIRMPPNDRSRYFDKTPAERLREWLGYKSTLILPLASDLSTRVFDALLAGLVPVVPRKVLDFDAVISPARQKELGIVRIDDFEIDTLRAAAREAERVFDAQGAHGARARHEEALARHTLGARLGQMLQALHAAARGERRIVQVAGAAGEPPGLRLLP